MSDGDDTIDGDVDDDNACEIRSALDDAEEVVFEDDRHESDAEDNAPAIKDAIEDAVEITLEDVEDGEDKLVTAEIFEQKRKERQVTTSQRQGRNHLDDYDLDQLPTTMSLPDNFPVTPLGIMGKFSFFLDGMQQIQALQAKDYTKNILQFLFVPRPEVVFEYWPRKDENGRVSGWKAEDCTTILMTHAAKAGFFNPVDKLRGRGCHRASDGQLVWHLGDKILKGRTYSKPGLIDGFVYSAGERCMYPATHRDIPEPAKELLELFSTWQFVNQKIAPIMLLGWLVAAKVSGYLDWRPLMWLEGDRETGKSTLQKVMTTVLGDVIAATNATPASIWQKLGYDTLPVLLDEQEAGEDDRTIRKMIELAREAASGGVIMRGGAEHAGREFQARSCFLFSSILHPPLSPQDVSRMAILPMKPLPKIYEDTPKFVLDLPRYKRIGQSLMDLFHQRANNYEKTLEIYQSALHAVGHSGRGGDVFGTILACAHTVLDYDVVWPEKAAIDAQLFKPALLAEYDEALADHYSCLSWLLTQEVDPWQGGAKKLVSALVLEASKDGSMDSTMDGHKARESLEGLGLKVLLRSTTFDRKNPVTVPTLIVANRHQGLSKIFKESKWRATSDADGSWSRSLRRIAGAKAWGNEKFKGFSIRGTALPIDAIMKGDDDDK